MYAVVGRREEGSAVLLFGVAAFESLRLCLSLMFLVPLTFAILLIVIA